MSSRPGHLGHRARLRDRFLDRGADALADYELIELLLFQALPRRDTKPVARALIARFGSYAGVLRAAPAELGEVDGMGKAAIAAIRTVAEAATRLAREEALGAEVLDSW